VGGRRVGDKDVVSTSISKVFLKTRSRLIVLVQHMLTAGVQASSCSISTSLFS